MAETVYSVDEETFTDWDSMMDELRENTDYAPGDMVEVLEGDAEKAKHSEFVHAFNWIEELQNRAYDEYGEWSADYLDDITKEKAQELETLVCGWLEKNAKSPTFFRVTNPSKTTVMVEEI